jgi:Spy/CpxP family protein refolding chaperone
MQSFPALLGVQLTPTQQTQLERLRSQTLPQVQNLLSPEQQEQFYMALSEGKEVRVAVLSFNLSVTQRLQIRNILCPMQSRVEAILTPEQQQQIQQNIQALQQQKH